MNQLAFKPCTKVVVAFVLQQLEQKHTAAYLVSPR